MEIIKNKDDIEKLSENQFIGNPKLNNTRIIFNGKNNLFVCDNNIQINNAILTFNGDNSIVYICSNLNNNFNLDIHHNSTVFIGKDVLMGHSIVFNVQENQNLIIGDDCMIGNHVNIYTSDYYPIYNTHDKKRINYSDSVYIGDHVWIGRFTYISKGNKIGSGSILGDKTVLPSYQKIKSNMFLSGNPPKIVKTDVFFIKDFLGNNKPDDTLNSQSYISDVFIYSVKNNETLDLNKIDKIIKELSVEDRLEFIQKLFIRNKRLNRFTIN